MTDNRTNEPTTEQVEAAADAAGRVLYPHWDEWEEHEDMAKAHGELMREAARAALVAAQGAAPAPSSGVDEDKLAEVRRAAAEKALTDAARQMPFPADPYGGFDYESLRAAFVQGTNWLRARAEAYRRERKE